MSKTILANLDGFTPVIDWMARDFGTNRALVFGRVWRYCQMRDGVCNASINTLAENTGLDEATIRRHLHELAAGGFLEDLSPGLANHPHTYRDTGKAGLQVSISALSKSEGAPSHGERPPLSKSEEKIVVKKETKERNTSAALAAGGISTVENEWADTPAQVVQVPQGGNQAKRAAYTERCDMCQADLSQAFDACPECGRPVRWEGSTLADKRQQTQKRNAADQKAKQAREDAERLSETTKYILQLAQASSPTGVIGFKIGEEQRLFKYEQAYGAKVVHNTADQFKAEGTISRGLILRLLAFFEIYSPNMDKGSGKSQPLATPDEWDKEAQKYLLRSGGGVEEN